MIFCLDSVDSGDELLGALDLAFLFSYAVGMFFRLALNVLSEELADSIKLPVTAQMWFLVYFDLIEVDPQFPMSPSTKRLTYPYPTI